MLLLLPDDATAGQNVTAQGASSSNSTTSQNGLALELADESVGNGTAMGPISLPASLALSQLSAYPWWVVLACGACLHCASGG